ncbi:MAG: hypothetical protein DDG60_14510 [Anaerolineae bacterium]|nr:MAG: hypothetical protein DDG60_14510 [Anaerolineae bacterium]
MLSPNGIRAIFYDLDGTLRTSQPPGRVIFAEHAARLGLITDAETRRRAAIWEHQYFAESPELVRDRQDFQDDSQAFWLNYCFRQLQILGASEDQARDLAPSMTAYMNEHFRPQDVIFDDVYETLRILREHGYFLGLLSNRFEPYTDYLAERGLDGFFDLVVHAGQAGIRKPHPAVFHFMLQKAGFRPEQSIYIGDNYFADVLGARQAGMLGVLYDPEGLFERPDCPVISKHTQILHLLKGNP